jgi:hypothetical protein
MVHDRRTSVHATRRTVERSVVGWLETPVAHVGQGEPLHD